MENPTLTQTILVQMPQNGGWVTVYEPTVIGNALYYGYLEDLRLYINVNSVTEAQLPELDVTDSQTYRITAVRDMEWQSQRKHFQLAVEKDVEGGSPLLLVVSEISCLNRFPYYQINILTTIADNVAYGIGAGARIKARMVDAGFGFLTGADSVHIFGSAKEERFSLPVTSGSGQSYQWPVTATSAIVLPENLARTQATLVNEGAATVYLGYGAGAIVGGIPLLPEGGSYEINATNPYTGAISAVCAPGQSSLLSGLEVVAA